MKLLSLWTAAFGDGFLLKHIMVCVFKTQTLVQINK